jgi:opacity protein-like surface antigen
VDLGYGSSQEGSRGTEWSADFLHKTANHVYFGVGGSEFRSKDTVNGSLVPGTTSVTRSKMSSIMGLVRADLNGTPKAQTYLIGGLGWVKHSLSITADGTSLVNDSKDAFGYMAGIGLDFALNDRLLIGVEGRYQGSVRKEFPLTPEGAAVAHQPSISVPLSVFFVGLKAGIKY